MNVRVGTAVLIMNNRHEVLVSRRLQGEGKGLLCLPGGKLDPGETIREAACRETLEETNLVIEPHHLCLGFDYDHFPDPTLTI